MISKKVARLASRSLDATDRMQNSRSTVEFQALKQIVVSHQCEMLDLADRLERVVRSSCGYSSTEEIPRPSRYRAPPGGSRKDGVAESDSAGEEYTFETVIESQGSTHEQIVKSPES